MFRRLSPMRGVVDASIAALYFLIVLFFAVNGTGTTDGVILAFALAVGVGFRRFSPAIGLAISWAAALWQMYVVHLGPVLPDLAILAVVYATAAYGTRRLRIAGLVSVFVAAALGGVYLWSGNVSSFNFNISSHSIAETALTVLRLGFNFVLLTVLLGLPWTAGTLVRTWFVARESRSAQRAAEQIAVVATEDVIVEQERNRIARDMHDVVAHSLAVVIAQADGARYAKQSDPDAVDEALSAISSTAREALGDVRLLLGQLRHSQGEGPQPALVDLDRLLEQLRASGLTIDYETAGTPIQLGTAQELAVYRIVQEGLTNALRHGDVSTAAVVRLAWTEDGIGITLTNSIGAPSTGELRFGHGLAGMRERAALVGGRLVTHAEDRRFVLTATIPAATAVRG